MKQMPPVTKKCKACGRMYLCLADYVGRPLCDACEVKADERAYNE